MTNAISEFEKAVIGIKQLDAIYNHLFNDLHLGVAASEILRSQLVYIVSAMDRYLHEIVRIGFLEEYHGIRIQTDAYNKWTYSSKKVAEIVNYGNPSFVPSSITETVDYVINSDVLEKNGVLAFQQPDKIKDALSLIWNEPHKMVKIAHQMNFEPAHTDNDRKKLLDQKIKLISIRRNQIVHEGDIDPVTLDRRTISKTVIEDCIDFIDLFVHSVHTLVTDRSSYVIP